MNFHNFSIIYKILVIVSNSKLPILLYCIFVMHILTSTATLS